MTTRPDLQPRAPTPNSAPTPQQPQTTTPTIRAATDPAGHRWSEMVGTRRSARAQKKTETLRLSTLPLTQKKPVAWDDMLEGERKGLLKQNTKLNRQTSTHMRLVERKPISRPASPTAATQKKQAARARRKRMLHYQSTGIELGPGENICFEQPKMLTPPKKGVRWGAPLEAGYSSEPETHSPSEAGKAKIGESRLAKTEVVLDKFGNSVMEDVSPSKAKAVVIKKVVYKGENGA